jgi:hypothetical protein
MARSIVRACGGEICSPHGCQEIKREKGIVRVLITPSRICS